MTAALVTAVLETENTALQIVTGNRPDLFKVKDTTESVVSASIDSLRYRKAIKPFLAAWSRYAYDEAAKGLAGLPPPANRQLKAEWFRLKDASSAFAAWDRFDHFRALELLKDYAPSAGPFWGPYLAALRTLVANQEGMDDAEDPKTEPLKMFDLWKNASRRAAQGRYDDAMARCYRLIEWAAQWILRKKHGIDTGNLPAEIAEKWSGILPDSEGKFRVGLMKAWELIRLRHDGPAADFARKHANSMLDRIKERNSSILAHGRMPIEERAWLKMADWTNENFIPVLIEETTAYGIREMPPQLPADAAPLLVKDI
jgi:CRISPR-associated protein (TIGR02710 family)